MRQCFRSSPVTFLGFRSSSRLHPFALNAGTRGQDASRLASRLNCFWRVFSFGTLAWRFSFQLSIVSPKERSLFTRSCNGFLRSTERRSSRQSSASRSLYLPVRSQHCLSRTLAQI